MSREAKKKQKAIDLHGEVDEDDAEYGDNYEEKKEKKMDSKTKAKLAKEKTALVKEEEGANSGGGLQKLEVLNLNNCKGLTSLPSELSGLQALEMLELGSCDGLTSLPDLSGLKKLKVRYLPEKLTPWEDGGRKAFALG